MDFNEWVQLKKQVEEDLNRFFQSLQILERLVLELSEKESSVSTKDLYVSFYLNLKVLYSLIL